MFLGHLDNLIGLLWVSLFGDINRPRNLEQKKENIIQGIRNLTPDILRKIMETVSERMRLC